MEPLNDPRLKIRRAEEHIDELRGAAQDFISRPHWSMTLEDDPQFPPSTYRFNVTEKPPLYIGTIVGDIVSNLRAALDHIIWQAALRHRKGRRPDRKTSFPIYDDAALYVEKSRGSLRHISRAARDVVESLQPYHRPDWPETYLLHVLNELVRVDKHQTIMPVIGAARIETNRGEIIRLPTLDDGDRVTFSVPKPLNHDLEIRVLTSIGVVVDGVPLGSPYFLQIHDFVRDEVLPRFAPFV